MIFFSLLVSRPPQGWGGFPAVFRVLRYYGIGGSVAMRSNPTALYHSDAQWLGRVEILGHSGHSPCLRRVNRATKFSVTILKKNPLGGV
jgi:hypothetical protein